MNFRVKPVNLFFFLGTLFLTLNLLTYQALELSQYKYTLRIAGIGLLLLVLITKFNGVRIKWGLVIVAAYTAGLVVFGSSDQTGNAINMIAIIIVMFAAQCIEYKDLLKIFYKVAVISIIVWVALMLTGQIHITAWEATRQAGIGSSMHTITTVRYSLGFLYEINLGGWYLTSALTIILLYKGMTRIRVAVVTALNILIYIITDSRTTFLFYLAFLAGYYFFNMYKKRDKVIGFFNRRIKTVYALVFIVPFVSTLLMKFLPWLDTFLSGRLWGIEDRMAGMSVFNYLFGCYNMPLACFYYLVLTNFGIFVYIYFYFAMKNGSNYYLSQKKLIEFCFIFAMVLVGLIEGSIFAVEELSTIVFWSLIGRGFCLAKMNTGIAKRKRLYVK